MNKPEKRLEPYQSLTPAQKFLADHAQLQGGFNQIFRTNDGSKILKFIEEFAQAYPLSKNMIKQMYEQLSQLLSLIHI